MAIFTDSDDLSAAQFNDVDLTRARFVGANLSSVVMRGVELHQVELDSPWLFEGDEPFLRVNGVDVLPLVDAELNRRFPGRAEREAENPEALRVAWSTVEKAWAAALERVEAMPAGTVDESVDGEWTFTETLRHLVMATDVWLGKAIQGADQPFHPLGLTFDGGEEAGLDMSVFATTTPSYPEVLEARADRVALVRDYLAGVTLDDLPEAHPNPWNPTSRVSTLHCLHTILQEEWEHLRYATRDLDAIEVS